MITSKQLRKAAKLTEKIEALQASLGAMFGTTCTPRKAKRRMSKAGRKAIAAAARRRWKAIRAAKKIKPAKA